MSVQQIRRLSGHLGSILCCHSPLSDLNLIATSGQDGRVCLFDIRSESGMHTFESFGQDGVSSICFLPGSTHVLYAAAGTTVYCIDIRMVPSGGEPVHKCSFNTDEINQISLNTKGSLLAAADDNGEIKVIDLKGHKLFKTLRNVHTNICSTVQFHPHRPWELISGGLDAKLVKWDLCKGRPVKTIDQAGHASQCSSRQICNPPFVHCIAISEEKSSSEARKLVAVARGDGAVEFVDLMLEKWWPGVRQAKSLHQKRNVFADADIQKQSLESSNTDLDGHKSSVSCVTVARFNPSKTIVISGSNDKSLKLWDLEYKNESNSDSRFLLLSVDHKRKVNWISSSVGDSENLFVADTSNKLTIYSIS